MSKNMQGKIALVTGGGTGIGRAAALAFAREGAKIAISGRTPTTGMEVVHLIQDSGGQAIWIQADVSVAAQVDAMAKQVLDNFGRLDFAFNNAGSGALGARVHEIDEADWDKTIDGYLKSVFLCMKVEIGLMLKTGCGAIVNNSSVDGQRAFPPDPAYSAAKHGVLGLTKSAAVQYAGQGIRINAVCPGWILTPPVEAAMQTVPSIEAQWLTHQPVGRMGKPEEVAEAVIWLCSEKASLVTGTALAVDGGYLAV